MEQLTEEQLNYKRELIETIRIRLLEKKDAKHTNCGCCSGLVWYDVLITLIEASQEQPKN